MPHPSSPSSPDQPPRAVGGILSLDVESALRAADEALALRLGTVTRQEIDTRTAELRGHVGLFAEAVLDHARTAADRSVRWEVDQLLASTPRDGALVFSAYQHLRDLARMLRRLADSAAEHGVTS
ncbi:DUF6415 family natural product biosynthesis protein [Streptomyces sp. ML-6]|uniref:DUF6415 family natural product biosynthesis protein n=1 Tax=Streptomyces sp. ML-6 TaxID=2982693 RepID=UPI0024C07BC4|nr:DUF6415 family natural product biosynthesis protein [Streptomyces sp. ML-6]MDK0519221.1 DUF6415 family natural product biosynthesis protein [Streptomyces sp. ML-6]